MKAVILAAGKGTRMRPLTLDKPKQLVELLGKPILTHILEELPDPIHEIILVIGYKGDMIKAYFGSAFMGKPITYVEQKELTGHIPALQVARPYLELEKEGRFLSLFGEDLVKREDLERLIRHPFATLVHEVDDPKRFGIVVPDPQGNVLEVEEKPEDPKSNLAFTGASVFDEKIFQYEPEMHKNGEFYLTPVIQKIAREHPVRVEKASFWFPIGIPEDLERAEQALRDIK